VKGLPLNEQDLTLKDQDLTLKDQDHHLKVKAHHQINRMMVSPSEAKRIELIRTAKAAFSVRTTCTKIELGKEFSCGSLYGLKRKTA